MNWDWTRAQIRVTDKIDNSYLLMAIATINDYDFLGPPSTSRQPVSWESFSDNPFDRQAITGVGGGMCHLFGGGRAERVRSLWWILVVWGQHYCYILRQGHTFDRKFTTKSLSRASCHIWMIRFEYFVMSPLGTLINSIFIANKFCGPNRFGGDIWG